MLGLHSCGGERTDEMVVPDKELQQGRTPSKASCMEVDACGHVDNRTSCLGLFFFLSYSKFICASNCLILAGKSYKLLRRQSSVLLRCMC